MSEFLFLNTTVQNSEGLHRRIHPSFLKQDGRISSQAFRDSEMSVDRAEFRGIDETMKGYLSFGLVRLTAEDARDLGQEVVGDPDLANPAHALVKGKKSKRVARCLAGCSEWVVAIGEMQQHE